jgi:hypothetical protein
MFLGKFVKKVFGKNKSKGDGKEKSVKIKKKGKH